MRLQATVGVGAAAEGIYGVRPPRLNRVVGLTRTQRSEDEKKCCLPLDHDRNWPACGHLEAEWKACP